MKVLGPQPGSPRVELVGGRGVNHPVAHSLPNQIGLLAADHPFAMTKFSRAGSAKETVEGSTGLWHIHPRRRLPIPGHASRRRRLPVHGRAPDCVEDINGQWPTIHKTPSARDGTATEPASGTSTSLPAGSSRSDNPQSEPTEALTECCPPSRQRVQQYRSGGGQRISGANMEHGSGRCSAYLTRVEDSGGKPGQRWHCQGATCDRD